MDNIMTIDVEEWFHANGPNLSPDTWSAFAPRARDSTLRLLDLLDEYAVKATFFTLGWIAERHPDLVKEIRRRGHLIGSHGSKHRMVSRMSAEEFRRDLRESLDILEDLTGEPVRCFRAPSWSITPERTEVFLVLEEEGIRCDSSLQPFRTPLSGSSNVPLAPFRPVVNGRPLDLVEIPPSVLKLGFVKVPFAGGFYLRFWPAWVSRLALRNVNRTRPGMLYAHPWEFDGGIPRLKLPFLIRLAQYYRLGHMEGNFRSLLAAGTYVPLEEYLKNGFFPEIALDSPHSRPSEMAT